MNLESNDAQRRLSTSSHYPPKPPKNFVSGFNHFAKTYRATMMTAEHKNLSNNEINMIVGRCWKQLPPDEKAVYVRMGEEDKLRYLQEVHDFNTNHGGNIIPKIDPPPGYGLDGKPLPSTSLTEPKKRGRKKKDSIDSEAEAALVATRLARKRSAYSVFAHQERKFLEGLVFDNMQKTLGKYISQRWWAMDPREMELYTALAAESGGSGVSLTASHSTNSACP